MADNRSDDLKRRDTMCGVDGEPRKTLVLTPNQYDILVDVALEERRAIRESMEHMHEDDIPDAIKTYDELGLIFDLEAYDGPYLAEHSPYKA